MVKGGLASLMVDGRIFKKHIGTTSADKIQHVGGLRDGGKGLERTPLDRMDGGFAFQPGRINGHAVMRGGNAHNFGAEPKGLLQNGLFAVQQAYQRFADVAKPHECDLYLFHWFLQRCRMIYAEILPSCQVTRFTSPSSPRKRGSKACIRVGSLLVRYSTLDF
ncbi:hypothetical protein SDC9_177197 [bioreactor metagenome]|uniref:Uncharacterized protein n=1 Tax=bioreactor metagenome TaxID=1076179 RepID=A0A645H0A9_9ZZZZ